MEVAEDANNIVDNYDGRNRTPDETVWHSLTRMGLHFENVYLGWRERNPKDAKLASYRAMETLPEIFREMARTAAATLVDAGHKTMSREARALLDRKFEYRTTAQIMRRSVERAYADFKNWTPETILALRFSIEGRTAENRRLYDETVARMQANMHNQINQFWVDTATTNATNTYNQYANVICTPDQMGLYSPDPKQVKKTQLMLRDRQLKERRVIKRSVKFLTRLLGHDTTRMFIGGDNIRIEGKHAIYELRKVSRLNSAHGGFRALSIFHKEHPDLLLCNLCIYTPDVPLLDHVASLVMHIQAGEEEEILRIGNPSTIHETAYELEWLAPHLPKKYVRLEPGHGLDNEPPVPWDHGFDPFHPRFGELNESPRFARKRAKRDADVARMLKVVARDLYDDVLADFTPLFRKMNLNFRLEHTMVWATVTNTAATNGPNVVYLNGGPNVGQIAVHNVQMIGLNQVVQMGTNLAQY
jgi:hypothetical protein